MTELRKRVATVATVAALGALASCSLDRSSPPPKWFAVRAGQQVAALAQSSVTHDFRFTDISDSSGISFVHRIVEDAGKNYKAVHYDHGTGLCAADVDGDSRTDLYFVTQLGSNELWRNVGGGKFTDVTESAGLRLPDAIAVGCAFGDVDNDGRPDLFVTTVRHGNRLFQNVGGGQFRDISASAGVDYSGHSSGALFFDYDRDGLLDLLVTNVGMYTTDAVGPGGYYVGTRDAFRGHTDAMRGEASVLYRNLGSGKFADVTQQTRLVDYSWSGDAIATDVNDDGYPDVYMLDMQGNNHLWLSENGRTFRDASAEYFPRTPWGAMGAKVFDFNGDGRLDLYVTDMHSDMFADVSPDSVALEGRKSDPRRIPPGFVVRGNANSVFGNALFANRADSAGRAHFTDVSDDAGAETYWPWGPSVEDLNADGWDDLFVTGGMNFPFRYAQNSLLLNEGGKRFLSSEFALGVEPRSPHEQLWFTLDCAGADKDHLYCGTCEKPEGREKGCRRSGERRFSIMGARGSRSSVIFDLEGDGDLDIVTNEFNGAPLVFRSDLASKHKVNAITVRLRGTKSNRPAIGARVTIVLPDGRRLLKLLDGKSGYLSVSDLPLYFGLGPHAAAASIEVVWPSGARQTVNGPFPTARPVEIVEP